MTAALKIGAEEFGKWHEILKEPSPAFDGPLVMRLWHFARGMAFSPKGDFDSVQARLARC